MQLIWVAEKKGNRPNETLWFHFPKHMNYEQKSNLEKALISQTYNKSLAGAVVNAIEEDLKRPKPKQEPSALKIAIEKEKGRSVDSQTDIHETSEE